ncbi:hypothetical protein HMPREF9238_00984 [Gleimia europaea ACS-120-V-Col10b]|uniref:Uncharacterized protein n=1 Tax=Gleimia europaea ACS-120-V-Col10b TaxID=883069 RepID=A0A9W5RF41_9ACTO|nr:hypothetical protein HMPREF9238_00984 [Gleimia europaea ACS-120-V-Col10b]
MNPQILQRNEVCAGIAQLLEQIRLSEGNLLHVSGGTALTAQIHGGYVATASASMKGMSAPC